ncbi:MAG: pilin [Patescibacteria group bacterium]
MKYLAFLTLLLVLPLLALAQDTTGTPNTSVEFIPLTNVPFLTETGNAFSLETFLNGLYRISIGVAAVVAVLQIMRAGIMYMGGDSVTEKKEAKNLIALSIGGLILVLSPVVVFSVINPEILTLKIGNIEKLKGTSSPVSAEVAANTLFVYTGSDRAGAQTRCEAAGGTAVFSCQPKAGGAGRTVSLSGQCNSATENDHTVCRTPQGGVGASCGTYARKAAAGSGICNGNAGFVQIGSTCCGTLAAGAVCCGSNTAAAIEAVSEPIKYFSYQAYNKRTTTSEHKGIVPNDVLRIGTYVNSCTRAGGEMKYDRDDNALESFAIARWGACPGSTGVPATTGNADTEYQCEDRTATCEIK